LGPVLSQGAGCLTKPARAGIAVQILLAPDHESGCRNVFEGTWRWITGYRTAIRLDLEQDFSSKNRDKKMTTTDRVRLSMLFAFFMIYPESSHFIVLI
jgi:hypothetical protein